MQMQPIIPSETVPFKTETNLRTKEANDTDSFLAHLSVCQSIDEKEPGTGEDLKSNEDLTTIDQNEMEQIQESQAVANGYGITEMTDKSTGPMGLFLISDTFEWNQQPVQSGNPFEVPAVTAMSDGQPLSRMTGIQPSEIKPASPMPIGMKELADQVTVKTMPHEDASLISFPTQEGAFFTPILKPENVQAFASENNMSSNMDPRFAELLASKASGLRTEPPSEPVPLSQETVSKDTTNITLAESPKETFFEMSNRSQSGNSLENSDSKAVSSQAEGLTFPQIQAGMSESPEIISIVNHSQNAPYVTPTNQENAAIKLPSGSLVPENRIVEQVVEQISIKSVHENSSLTIKVHPEELGRLHMELIADKDGIKAYIHTQTPQVQEVLERHIHRLREGFEQQGLKIDEIQVSVNSEQNSGPGFHQEQHGPRSLVRQTRAKWSQESPEASTVAETPVPRPLANNVISLRV